MPNPTLGPPESEVAELALVAGATGEVKLARIHRFLLNHKEELESITAHVADRFSRRTALLNPDDIATEIYLYAVNRLTLWGTDSEPSLQGRWGAWFTTVSTHQVSALLSSGTYAPLTGTVAQARREQSYRRAEMRLTNQLGRTPTQDEVVAFHNDEKTQTVKDTSKGSLVSGRPSPPQTVSWEEIDYDRPSDQYLDDSVLLHAETDQFHRDLIELAAEENSVLGEVARYWIQGIHSLTSGYTYVELAKLCHISPDQAAKATLAIRSLAVELLKAGGLDL